MHDPQAALTWRGTASSLVRQAAARMVTSRAALRVRRNAVGRRVVGSLEARAGRPPQLRQQDLLDKLPASLEQGLTTFVDTWGAEAVTDKPVFALSAGWRSGSTLLQRLLISSGDILMWGEPYDNSCYVQRLCDSFRPFAAGMAQRATFAGASAEELSRSWVANLYPHPADLLAAHRAFFRTLLADPAAAQGFSRWGLKETRLGGPEVRYLRMVFPASSVVLLVRDPLDAWRSYSVMEDVWYASWPDRPVTSAVDFAVLWNELASSMHALASKDPGVLLLRFEDMVLGGKALRDLSEFTGLAVDQSILSVKVGGTGSGRETIPFAERRAIARIAGATATKFGYEL